MQKIVQGVRAFQKTVFREQQELFRHLAAKPQSPQALFVTCSDSRINPNLITQTEPGELFILRNAGNIIPPYGAANGGEGATVEYAVSVLKVRNLIICGHYHCGAMHYLVRLDRNATDELAGVRAWCAHADATRRIVKDQFGHLTEQAIDDRAVEQNVLVQINNLRTHPCVAAGIARGDLAVYGWVYRIETGDVSAYEPVLGRFISLTDCDPNPGPSTPHLAVASGG
jgi:carbonic anhydrase